MKVGVIGGGFKPPHKGHFAFAKQALSKVPDLDKLLIYVGGKVRAGAAITQNQAIEIWKLYANELPGAIEILPADQPIAKAYSQASKNPGNEVFWFLGVRDEDDAKEADRREVHLRKNPEKYSNLNVIRIADTGTDVSGTKARKALEAGDKEAFFQALPDVVDKDKVYDIVKTPETKMADAIDELFANFMYEEQEEVEEVTKGSHAAPIAVLPSEERQKLQNYTKILQDALPDEFDVEYRQDHIRVSVPYFDKNKNHQDDWTPHQRQLPEEVAEETTGQFDFAPHIASILEYCMTKGMKVTPIPEVKIRQDEENAANLFGKTGYYDPQNREIVLYVTGRHPKDVLRSFCHELIHHMQNLEGQNLTFYTTDVHANEELKAIEQEAHAKGSFLFRDWENSNKEQAPIDKVDSLQEILDMINEAGLKDFEKQALIMKIKKAAKGSASTKHLEQIIDDLIKKLEKPSATGVKYVHGKRVEEGTKYRSIVVDVRKAVNEALNKLLKGEKLGGYNLPIKREPTEEDRKLAKQYGFTPLGLMLNSEYQSAYLGVFKSQSEKGTPTEVGVSLKFALSDEVEKGKYYVDGEASADEAELDIILAFNPEDGTNMLQQIQPTLTDLIRHETEHLTQSGEQVKPDKWMRGDQARRQKIRQNPELFYKYFLLPKEVDANIQGLYAKSKYDKTNFQDTVDAYLTDLVGDGIITQANSKQIYNKWKTRAAEIGGIPELK